MAALPKVAAVPVSVLEAVRWAHWSLPECGRSQSGSCKRRMESVAVRRRAIEVVGKARIPLHGVRSRSRTSPRRHTSRCCTQTTTQRCRCTGPFCTWHVHTSSPSPLPCNRCSLGRRACRCSCSCSRSSSHSPSTGISKHSCSCTCRRSRRWPWNTGTRSGYMLWYRNLGHTHHNYSGTRLLHCTGLGRISNPV
jgi:hypothetical protein